MTKLPLAAIALTVTLGCNTKTHFSPSCSRAIDLVAPWTDLGIPLGDNIRVCSANDLKVDLEYLTGDKAEWEQKYDEVMTAKGYTKDRCSAYSCSYSKAGEQVSVQINQLAAGKRAMTIVHLTRTQLR